MRAGRLMLVCAAFVGTVSHAGCRAIDGVDGLSFDRGAGGAGGAGDASDAGDTGDGDRDGGDSAWHCHHSCE